MAKLTKPKGATSQILEIFIQDSESTTGAGKTGLAHDTASLTAYYHRNTAATAVEIELVDMTVGTFTASGFKEVDSVNMPGFYQLCVPDAAYATGADSFSVMLKGASGMAPLPLEVQLGIDVNLVQWLGVAPLALTAQKVNSALDSTERTSIAAAVWNALTSGLTTVGSIGKYLLDKLTLVSAGSITVTAPVNAVTQALEVVRGDSYEIGTPRPLLWESADFADYDVATVLFKARSGLGSVVFSKAGAMVTTTQVRVELTAAETADFSVGKNVYDYEIEATLTNADIVTFVIGKMTVIADVL